jgi:hypothetical protein
VLGCLEHVSARGFATALRSWGNSPVGGLFSLICHPFVTSITKVGGPQDELSTVLVVGPSPRNFCEPFRVRVNKSGKQITEIFTT